jgi:hypothetical protein
LYYDSLNGIQSTKVITLSKQRRCLVLTYIRPENKLNNFAGGKGPGEKSVVSTLYKHMRYIKQHKKKPMKITRHTRREHSSRLTSTVVGHSVSMETSGMTNQRLTYKIKAGTSQTPKRRAVTAPTVCLFTRATFRRVRSLAPTASQRACSRWHSTQSVL